MKIQRLPLEKWWYGLPTVWQEIFIDNLELDGFFSSRNVEYVHTITELDCSGRPIRDLFPLRYLPQLEVLDISDTAATGWEVLKELPNLREFHASFCELGDFSIIAQLHNLEVLDVSYSFVNEANWHILHKFPELKELYCNACHPHSLQGFTSLDKLRVLSVFFNDIKPEDVHLFREQVPGCKILS